MIANTPDPPYYVVIFTSVRTECENGYPDMSKKMMELVEEQDGYLGCESAREDVGITLSYWKDLESIRKWKENTEHMIAQNLGREVWYKSFKTRIARVEKVYNFEKDINNE